VKRVRRRIPSARLLSRPSGSGSCFCGCAIRTTFSSYDAATTQTAQNQGVCRCYSHPEGELGRPDVKSVLALKSSGCLIRIECKSLTMYQLRFCLKGDTDGFIQHATPARARPEQFGLPSPGCLDALEQPLPNRRRAAGHDGAGRPVRRGRELRMQNIRPHAIHSQPEARDLHVGKGA